MPFERKHQPPLSNAQFLKRMAVFLAYAAAIISFSMGLGTWGYCHYGRLSWVDGFYNAAMILTGMGPVAILVDDDAKLFASFYALYSGVAFLTTISVVLAPVIHRMFHILHADLPKEEEDDAN